MSRRAADSSVFDAIADPTRRAILDRLRDGDECVSELMATLSKRGIRTTQSAFSQHLAVLRGAGLVEARKAGNSRIYQLRVLPLAEVAGWIAQYDRFWEEKLDQLGRYLAASSETDSQPGPSSVDKQPSKESSS
jgi:DNA-binding transcriptional ArsR family regulator